MRVGLLHYSAPPVIGGVESVLLTHTRLFVEAGYPVTILAGRGEQQSLPPAAHFILIPELDSQYPDILKLTEGLETGQVPPGFEETVAWLVEKLAPLLKPIDLVIVHNVFTKHFNLPLTAALVRLIDEGALRRCIAWCHDMTWTSSSSRSKVHPGYPWDLLRTFHPKVRLVTISQERQRDLADLLGCLPERIRVVYNGVDPKELLGLSEEGSALADRLDLWESDLNLLLPVRVTQAKNIELAIRVVAALKERGILSRLVITGPPDPHDPKNMEYFEGLLRLRDELRVSQQVRFVYESGPAPSEPLIVEMGVVAELFRVSDALLMPSHREGFGIPILEAGLAGLPVFCSTQIPAANEIGGQDVTRFPPEAKASDVAGLIARWMETSPVFQLRRSVRQNLTWQRIFQGEILPLVHQGDA